MRLHFIYQNRLIFYVELLRNYTLVIIPQFRLLKSIAAAWWWILLIINHTIICLRYLLSVTLWNHYYILALALQVALQLLICRSLETSADRRRFVFRSEQLLLFLNLRYLLIRLYCLVEVKPISVRLAVRRILINLVLSVPHCLSSSDWWRQLHTLVHLC
jgi:hypothetical protein